MTKRSAIESTTIEPPYDTVFRKLLCFKTLADAQRTLASLERLRQSFLTSGDRKGLEYCRQVARLGRLRSEVIGRNARVAPAKRALKREIALWFEIWLETPDLFCEWLDLRKKTEAFHTVARGELRDRSGPGRPSP